MFALAFFCVSPSSSVHNQYRSHFQNNICAKYLKCFLIQIKQRYSPYTVNTTYLHLFSVNTFPIAIQTLLRYFYFVFFCWCFCVLFQWAQIFYWNLGNAINIDFSHKTSPETVKKRKRNDSACLNQYANKRTKHKIEQRNMKVMCFQRINICLSIEFMEATPWWRKNMVDLQEKTKTHFVHNSMSKLFAFCECECFSDLKWNRILRQFQTKY